jgi:hypothetical protein
VALDGKFYFPQAEVSGREIFVVHKTFVKKILTFS